MKEHLFIGGPADGFKLPVIGNRVLIADIRGAHINFVVLEPMSEEEEFPIGTCTALYWRIKMSSGGEPAVYVHEDLAVLDALGLLIDAYHEHMKTGSS